MDKNLLHKFFDSYTNYKANDVNSDFISHQQLMNKIESIKANKLFEVQSIGKSIERREIYSIKFGSGRTKIFAWSQMHGDEPTATTALLDLINFFSTDDDLNSFRNEILNNLEIHFMPMVNPDGAERHQRENAYNIDLNRDALRLEADESKLLWNYADKLQPEFGFNLHDQNSYYTAGRTNNCSAISLLAPPMDYVKSINYTREKSMQVILKINEALGEFIPNQIARYSDDFEPRAFGDNFTKIGISTILIESGYFRNDNNKDFVRKMNFISLLTAFHSITEKNYEKNFYADYFNIPENNKLLFDLVLRNLNLEFNNRNFLVDIGINRKKKFNSETKEFYFEGAIADIGDLSIFYGIEELDLSKYLIQADQELKIDSPANFIIQKDERILFEVQNGFIKKMIS